MLADKASWAAATAEGLELVPSRGRGAMRLAFRNVYYTYNVVSSNMVHRRRRRGGYLGVFATSEEADLCYMLLNGGTFCSRGGGAARHRGGGGDQAERRTGHMWRGCGD